MATRIEMLRKRVDVAVAMATAADEAAERFMARAEEHKETAYGFWGEVDKAMAEINQINRSVMPQAESDANVVNEVLNAALRQAADCLMENGVVCSNCRVNVSEAFSNV